MPEHTRSASDRPDTVEVAEGPGPKKYRLPLIAAAAVVAGLLLIYTVGDRDPGLITQSVVTGLLLGGVYALVSVGLTLIFGVLGIVNFAHGAMLSVAMFIVYWLTTSIGLPVYFATFVAAPLMLGFGYLVQRWLLNNW